MGLFRSARDGKDDRSLFVEGRRLVEELLSSKLKIRAVAVTPLADADPRIAALVDKLKRRGAPIHFVTPPVMAFLSDMETPPGLAVLAERPAPFSLDDLAKLGQPAPLLVLLDGVQSPANAGAVVRVAEAAGVHGVGALPGTADLLSPKALRASAGSAFRVPLFAVSDLPSFLSAFPEPPALLAADAGGNSSYYYRDWLKPCALILGAEGRGVSAPAKAGLKVDKINIPMSGAVESLNVAVAAGILLMEAHRQRREADQTLPDWA